MTPPRHAAPEPEGEIDYVDVTYAEPSTPSTSEPQLGLPTEPIEVSAITAQQLRYVRAGRVILDGVSLVAAPGEVLGIVGPSGSGKSSLMALLAELEVPDEGTVAGPASRRLGLVLQAYGLAGVLTAAENVEIPLQAGVLGQLSRRDVRERAAVALAAVGLTAVAGHLTEELSGGQQQRLAIARALAVDPTVLLADELTAEVDHTWRDQIVELVFTVARRGGVVVVATHDPDLAARCDRLLRLVDGRASVDGTEWSIARS
jgi:putative ABC transport system ATP-binding protein